MKGIKKPATEALKRLKDILPDIHSDPQLNPSKFIYKYWTQYEGKFGRSSKTIDGGVFEELIAITLVRENIMPYYPQAAVSFIPQARYDLIVYTELYGPIHLSLKLSLRERWKMTDLECLALKNVHRSSKSYLVTLNHQEARVRKSKISECLAIEDYILADEPEYDNLLSHIKSYKATKPKNTPIIESSPIATELDFRDRYR